MFYYIPQIIFFIGLILVVWVIARNLPKTRKLEVSELMSNIEEEFEDFIEEEKKVLKNIKIEKVDAQVNSLLEKILRKVRINTIKFDNHLQKAIDSVKNGSKPKTIFNSEEKDEDDKVLDLKIEEETVEKKTRKKKIESK